MLIFPVFGQTCTPLVICPTDATCISELLAMCSFDMVLEDITAWAFSVALRAGVRTLRAFADLFMVGFRYSWGEHLFTRCTPMWCRVMVCVHVSSYGSLSMKVFSHITHVCLALSRCCSMSCRLCHNRRTYPAAAIRTVLGRVAPRCSLVGPTTRWGIRPCWLSVVPYVCNKTIGPISLEIPLY
jgi:hypothetical protein